MAAIGPTVLWASPFGPARDFASAVHLLIYSYPAWLFFTFISLAPGIYLTKRFRANPWLVIPFVAALVQVIIDAIAHWPPTRWWPVHVAGQMPVPSAYFWAIPVEAWSGYFYSLWPNAFMAIVAATSLLGVLLVLRLTIGWSDRGATSSMSQGAGR
jgi:hypothetical protein